MDTIKSQMQIGDKIIYPETAADCVKYDNTDAKTFMDGVLSSANLSQPIQQILQATDRNSIARILKTSPEIYFDECFNSWEDTNRPTVQNGDLVCTGNQYITTASKIPLTGDFTLQIAFTPDTIGDRFIWQHYITNNVPYCYLKINTNGALQMVVKTSTAASGNYTFTTSNSLVANTKYFFELGYNSTDKIFYVFLDGQLLDTKNFTFTANSYLIRLGANYTSVTAANSFSGAIHEYRASNILRHTSNHSISEQDFILDDYTLSLLHFD